MGFNPLKSLKKVAQGAVNVVTAPVKAVVNIAQGENVVKSITQAVSETVSGSVAGLADVTAAAAPVLAKTDGLTFGLGSRAGNLANRMNQVNDGTATAGIHTAVVRDSLLGGAMAIGAVAAAPMAATAYAKLGGAAGSGAALLGANRLVAGDIQGALQAGVTAAGAGGYIPPVPQGLQDAYDTAKPFVDAFKPMLPNNPHAPGGAFGGGTAGGPGYFTQPQQQPGTTQIPTSVLIGGALLAAYLITRKGR